MDFEEWKLWREEQSEQEVFYREMRSANVGLFLFGLMTVIVAFVAIYFVVW